MAIASDLPRVAVTDDLHRLRLTVFFRFFLALPHLIWVGMWGFAMLLLLPIQWVITLVKGRPDASLHEVYAMYTRYTLHVYAYASLAAEPFPGFLGRPGTYPVDLVIAPPGPQNRWSVGFRGILVLPPLLMSGALGTGVVTSGGYALAFSFGPAVIASFCGWFACLAGGRMPAGFRDVLAWSFGYAVQVAAYFFLVTAAYPDTDPRAAQLAPRPRHPVRLDQRDDPRRSRLTVFFRGILALPHFVWLTLWGLAVFLLAPIAWIVALVRGALPAALHRFLAAFVRYSAHVNAFAYLGGGPFPGFVGAVGSYPVDVAIDEPERQSRWTIGFRGLLAFPALFMLGALSGVLSAAAVGAWFFALARARMPRGLHATIGFCIRYTAQASAYALLLTGTYPHSGPSEEELVPGALGPAPPSDAVPTAPIPGPLAELEAR